MTHAQMAAACLQFVNKAQIPGEQARVLVECQDWLTAIAVGKLQLTGDVPLNPDPGGNGELPADDTEAGAP